MNEPVMPDWMKRAKEASESEKARAESAANARLLAQEKVKSGSHTFWKELKEQLAIQVKFLPDAFGMGGTVSVQNSTGGEEMCCVQVTHPGAVVGMTSMNLFYREGGSIIRMHPQFGGGGNVDLVWADGYVGLSLGGTYCDPESAATWIVQSLVKQINPSALKHAR